MAQKASLRTLHAIETLGVGKAERGDVRVDRLEARLTPKVPFPHKHDFYQLVFVKSGKGYHEIDFKKYLVKGQEVFILKPGQVHAWKFSALTKGFVVEFTTESLAKLEFANSIDLLPDHCVWNLKKKTASQNFLEMMEEEYQQKEAGYRLSLQNYLNILLLELSRRTESLKIQGSVQDSFSLRFSQSVEKNYKQHHSLEFYAKELKVTPKSLSARIQRTLGKPAKEVILQRCLLEAKRLLSFSKMPISEMGYELGFDDPNYFSRFLKQNIKMSAQEFRERSQLHSESSSKE
jgi:AraC family transcriptional activator of pobA